jgi:hypothetical protein
VVRKRDETKKIKSLMPLFENNFIWMKVKFKLFVYERGNIRKDRHNLVLTSRQQNKIVGVSDVTFETQYPLYKLIKLIKVNIGK